jgi:predicted metalloprotease with PDZ domain
MKKMSRFALIFILFVTAGGNASAQKLPGKMSFTVSMQNPGSHYFHVILQCTGIAADTLNLKMPAWSPGYYQLLNYAKNVEHFKAMDAAGNNISCQKNNATGWLVAGGKKDSITISYDVKATTPFVAQSFLDETRGYIIPASLFLYINGQLQRSSTIKIEPFSGWANVATGLDSIPGKPYTFFAPDFDVLYDSPILIGNLEELPPFRVKGIIHRFIGYQLGNFNRPKFMDDLKKIVEESSSLIGDIPYKHYTFLAIGPGRGGIEHLNSTTISFDGSQLNTEDGKRRMLSFIAHEYFHHYNVKRIRPIELGPFDYDKGNRTKLLWISEGLTVYYEYLVLKRQGLMSQDEILNALRTNISNYENKPGHLYQSVAQASYETWSDGPFGRTGDEVNKTISYYDKGPALGALLDFKIRNETKNKKSLDDVMRFLYKKYYQQLKRGVYRR